MTAKHIIHVNRQHIAMNKKDGGTRPVYIVRSEGWMHTRYADSVHVLGNSSMVYSATPLPCGARAWIETDSDVELINEVTFKEARDAG